MTNKHRIALTLIASLGLIAFGIKNANARSDQDQAKPAVIKPAKTANHATQLKHLPKGIKNDQLKQALNTGEVNHPLKLAKLDKASLLSDHDHAAKSVAKHQTVAKLHHGSKVSPKSLKNRKAHGLKVDHHQKEVAATNSVHIDHNKQNTNGMNQFSQSRHDYLYPTVGGNTRDLGGYQTSNHKYRIAPDRIIRSADLDGLTKSGLSTLKKLNVKKVIDLRYYTGKDGIEGHPDPSELRSQRLENTGIDYQMAPVYSHTEAKQLSKYMKLHNEHGEYYFYGSLSVSKPQAIRTYRKVFSDLLHNQHGAILFHCNLGRDRTGVTSALILSALGINRNVIFHDYLLTYRYHYHFGGASKYPERAAELQYFFKTIDKKYGSVNAYLSQAIGLNHAKIMKLRKMYLIPNK